MKKETFYFQHDYEPTSDPKIQALLGEYGGLGYGVFWRIVEMLHTTKDNRLQCKDYLYMAISNQMKTDAEKIKEIVNYLIVTCELLMTDGENIWSNRVDKYFEWRREVSAKCSAAGKAGVIAKQLFAGAEEVV